MHDKTHCICLLAGCQLILAKKMPPNGLFGTLGQILQVWGGSTNSIIFLLILKKNALKRLTYQNHKRS